MKKFIILFSFCLIALFVQSASEIKITVSADSHNRTDCIVSANISGLDQTNEESTIELIEITGRKKEIIPCQLVMEKGIIPTLYWILKGNTVAGSTRTFLAKRTKYKKTSNLLMSVKDSSNNLILKKEGKSVLNYNYTKASCTVGVDRTYEQSEYIHPVYSPSGFILTTVQPEYDRHHYGIWNSWAHIEYDKKTYDLWDLDNKQGAVCAQSIPTTFEGNILSGYTSILDHVIFTTSQVKVIMTELCKVKIWNIPHSFLWDFESNLLPLYPLVLKECSYGGLVYSATQQWNKENCEMVTSEGRIRAQIDGSRARWIYITGETEKGHAGLLILNHPDNFNSPQPLHIWDENTTNKEGDIVINFVPIQYTDWKLAQNQVYKLRYRFFAFDGKMTYEEANRLWNDFAEPPTVKILNTN